MQQFHCAQTYLFPQLLGGSPRRQPVGRAPCQRQGLLLPQLLPRLRPLAALPQKGRRRRRRGRQRLRRFPAVASRLGSGAFPGACCSGVAVEHCGGHQTQEVVRRWPHPLAQTLGCAFNLWVPNKLLNILKVFTSLQCMCMKRYGCSTSSDHQTAIFHYGV